jgi:DUF177 domain-containing protein
LLLHTADIGGEGRRVDETLTIGPLAGPDGREFVAGPVRVVGVVRKRSDGVGFRGQVDAVLELACSRCLETFRQRLESAFDLAYHEAAAPAPVDAEDREGELDAAEWMPLDEGRIDLSRLAIEQLYLALPLKPLCSEGCPGLCPVCGAPRRGAGCGCTVEASDPRWAALGDLKRSSHGS